MFPKVVLFLLAYPSIGIIGEFLKAKGTSLQLAEKKLGTLFI
jgi:hypothetical protein